MSRFAHKAVSIGSALAMAMSLVGSALAEEPSVATTTQSGSNVAQVVQTGSASSGSAVAGPGAKATTGNVRVEATVNVSQQIDQNANTSATGGSVAATTQTANNTANVGQAVAAASGNAVAVGSGAQASTGDVHVEAEVEVEQEIDQEADTEASALVLNGTTGVISEPVVVTPGVASTTQTATNTDIVLQAVVAQSGDAVASGTLAKATTGDVHAEAEVENEQEIDQEADTEVEGGIVVVVQTASQTINAVQGLVAASGNAVASVTIEDEENGCDSLAVGCFPFFFGFAVAESGDVSAEAEIEQEQEIDQEADADAFLIDEEDTDTLAAIFQAGFNTSIAYQFATVFSGDAGAFASFSEDEEDFDALDLADRSLFGTVATTGDVYAEFEIDAEQDIDQEADAEAVGGIAVIDQDVDNDAANFSALIQGSITGAPIFVFSGDAIAIGEDFEGAKAESGDVGTFRDQIEFELESEQEIDQEAEIFSLGVIGVIPL